MKYSKWIYLVNNDDRNLWPPKSNLRLVIFKLLSCQLIINNINSIYPLKEEANITNENKLKFVYNLWRICRSKGFFESSLDIITLQYVNDKL